MILRLDCQSYPCQPKLPRVTVIITVLVTPAYFRLFFIDPINIFFFLLTYLDRYYFKTKPEHPFHVYNLN